MLFVTDKFESNSNIIYYYNPDIADIDDNKAELIIN